MTDEDGEGRDEGEEVQGGMRERVRECREG